MKKIFVNNKNQLRSGWKIIITYAGSLFITSILNYLLLYILTSFNLKLPAAISNLFPLYISFIGLILSTLLAVHFIERNKADNFGLTNILTGYKDLLYGLIIGAVSISIIFAILLVTGNIILNGNLLKPQITISLLTGLILFILVGIGEEFFFRGYCQTVLKQTGSTKLAVIISSALFSISHFLNPNISIIGLINIFLVGLLFSYMFLKTDNIWMPIGYHITWNYFQGNIFGLSVSGNPFIGMYNVEIINYNLLTGGKFGPEGGLLTTIVVILGLLLVLRIPEK